MTQLYIPLKFNLVAQSQSVDLTYYFRDGLIPCFWNVWIDNSLAMSSCQVVCGGTYHTVSVPAKSSGFFPILEPMPATFRVYAQSGVDVFVYFIQNAMPFLLFNSTKPVLTGGIYVEQSPGFILSETGGTVLTES